MGAIGWIWAGLMLLGAARAAFTASLPPALTGAMLVSGLLTLPLLWDRNDGVLAAFAPPATVRSALALAVLLMTGLARRDALAALLPV